MRSFYKVTNSSKMTFRCPSEPILILLHLIKNIFFHFSTKISKLTLPFQRATSSIWAFAKSPNPSDPQALQPPNTGKNTHPKELYWTLNSLNIVWTKPNAKANTIYSLFSRSVSVLCNPFTMDLSRHYVNRPPFIQDCIRLFCSSVISFLHLYNWHFIQNAENRTGENGDQTISWSSTHPYDYSKSKSCHQSINHRFRQI